MLVRNKPAIRRLLLNWGVLIVAVTTVLVVRYRSEAHVRAPLPPPTVHLSATDVRQWRAFPSYEGTIPVLLYHGINSRNKGLSIQRRAFAEQMLALKTAGFHAITLAQYVNYVHGRDVRIPSRPILLTFDDGSLDTYRMTDKILQRYGFHGTMFTFAAWPTANPGFNLSWDELRSMQQSGTWSVQEHGGYGHQYVVYDAAGRTGGVYAFRQYIRGKAGQRGYLESYSSFRRRVTSSILWGARQLAMQIPGFRPLAFAVPYADYGQLKTNDRRVPQFMLPWLDRHFAVVFGGDYLEGNLSKKYQLAVRFSPTYAYRISVGPNVSLQALNCRLKNWVASTPIGKEYRCMHLAQPPPGRAWPGGLPAGGP